MTREFNFETSWHNKHKTAWLKENHKKKILENDFIVAMKELKRYSNANHKAHAYSPSKLKKEYKKLKDIYGFFKS